MRWLQRRKADTSNHPNNSSLKGWAGQSGGLARRCYLLPFGNFLRKLSLPCPRQLFDEPEVRMQLVRCWCGERVFLLYFSQAPSFGAFLFRGRLCYIPSRVHKPKAYSPPLSEKLAGEMLTSVCYFELSRGACTCLQAQENGAVLIILCGRGGNDTGGMRGEYCSCNGQK